MPAAQFSTTAPTKLANIVAQKAVLKAGADLGTGLVNAGPMSDGDIDVSVQFLTATSNVADKTKGVFIDAIGDIELQGVFAPQGAVRINATGVISIQDGTLADKKFLESKTGKVSNAPPILRIEEADPDDVIVPGDPTQEVVGTIGGIGAINENLELGDNFTIVVTWDDGVTTTLNLLDLRATRRRAASRRSSDLVCGAWMARSLPYMVTRQSRPGAHFDPKGRSPSSSSANIRSSIWQPSPKRKSSPPSSSRTIR